MKKLLLLFTLMLTCFMYTMAQKISSIKPGPTGYFPEYVAFDATSAPAFSNKAVVVNAKNQLELADALITGTERDANGTLHIRMQQVINNIPVEYATYISHVKKGRVIEQNGYWIDNHNELRAIPGISMENAVISATRYLGASMYKWQDAGEEDFIKEETGNPNASFYPKKILVYYNTSKEGQAPELRLAYKLDIYSSTPLMRKWVYVDANSGAILGTEDRIHETNATGTASTAYSGTQTITTDSYNGSYRLRETGRGNGIQTYNMKQGTNYRTAVDFTDTDNNWNNVNTAKDQYATDAHWGAEKTYDFYYQNFSRNSIDNAGFQLKSYVHYSRNYFNAFWDGTRMTYGDGSSTDGYKPLTAIDVCGHEISHGLTSNTARLTYSNESGALNEGFSDIFGTAIEWFSRPTKADWLIGGDFYVIRSMSNPKAYSQPSTYKKQYWYTGTSDNGGVHTNSGVLNFWFYLLTQGGNGTNDNSFAYNVNGIGMNKSQAIAFRALTVYLTSSSNYANARTYTIKAAEDLYGIGSNEAIQTKNAWDAVGVGGGLSAAGKMTDMFAKNVATEMNMMSAEGIYPNPAQTSTLIKLNSAANGYSIIEMIDSKGIIVSRQRFLINKGNNQVEFQFPTSAPTGLYRFRQNGQVIGSVIKN